MTAVAVALLLFSSRAPVGHAQDAGEAAAEAGDVVQQEAEADADRVTLASYLEALAAERLLAEESGSASRLRELVRLGEERYFDGRFGEAALLLFEVVESPRFADFVELTEFRGAEYMLAGALQELGALRSAERYLLSILDRGADDPYFGPAMRRFTDVALLSGDLRRALARVEGLDLDFVPPDAENELRYLRGRERYDAQDLDGAEAEFGDVTRRSRFYANAQYFRGVIATRDGELDLAEERFCSIATTGDQDRYTFYVDDRFFAVKDLAWLALGRVAHEGQRSEDAFYYYFQVPQDSERVAEALFEAAFAMYEGDDDETAVDLLDQLEARFPESPFVDEAQLLRGYVHLGRCEYEEARQLFQRFLDELGPVVAEIDRVLESPARQAGIYRQLLDDERRRDARVRAGGDAEPSDAQRARGALMSLLRVDPTFYRLHADVRTLDAESARAGRLATEIEALAARLRGADSPRAAVEQEGWVDAHEQLRDDVAEAREMLTELTRQLDVMRSGGATPEQLRPLEEEIRGLADRIERVDGALSTAVGDTAEGAEAPGGEAAGVEALLRRDARAARRLPGRVARTRASLVAAANDAALSALRQLRARLASGARRARIGQIDAVMGSKRRIEIQIQSLAAGRFPAELRDPLSVQGLLRDDEEYWPFEGELWEDELAESAGDEE